MKNDYRIERDGNHFIVIPSMLRRVLLGCILIFVTTSCLWAQGTSPGNSQGCDPKELLTAVVRPTDPVYAETVELTQELESHGYVVRCVLQSKFINTFQGQLGAALYRTNRGDFEALFLTKPLTFDSVRLVERQQNGRYLYLFQGTPRSANSLDSNRRTFFSKHANRLFIAWGGQQLAADLGEVLNSI